MLDQTDASRVGLFFIDMSTCEFYTQATQLPSLQSAIARIGPREIVLGQGMNDKLGRDMEAMLLENRHMVAHHRARKEEAHAGSWLRHLETPLSSADMARFTAEEIAAGTLLLDYVDIQLQGLPTKLQPPIRQQATDVMSIDKNSLRSLEIKSTLKDGLSRGSLLHAMQKTVTSSGARLLSDWLSMQRPGSLIFADDALAAPSTSLSVINGRLDLISVFLEDSSLRQETVSVLCKTFDSQRLVQKFSLGRGDHDDLLSLCKTIQASQMIKDLLRDQALDAVDPRRLCVAGVLRRLDLLGPGLLADQIVKAIDEDGLTRRQHLQEDEAASVIALAQEVSTQATLQPGSSRMSQTKQASGQAGMSARRHVEADDEDAWIMRRTATTTLDRLHGVLEDVRVEKEELAESLRRSYNASSLTLRWTPGLGHICHVKGKDARSPLSSAENVRSVSASKSTRSFHVPEWTRLGVRLDQLKMQIRAEEQQIFRALRDKVVLNLVKLRGNAAVLDELDIACASAMSAESQGLVRPMINSRSGHRIIGGRHPMVERGLEEQGRKFISNDCLVGGEERIWLITG